MFFLCHIRAVAYFGGVSLNAIPDNLKAVVLNASWCEEVRHRKGGGENHPSHYAKKYETLRALQRPCGMGCRRYKPRSCLGDPDRFDALILVRIQCGAQQGMGDARLLGCETTEDRRCTQVQF